MNSTTPGLSNSRLGRKWMECIDKEKGKERCWSKKTGAFCPYPKYLKVVKYVNRRVRRACYSTQVFALSVSQEKFPL